MRAGENLDFASGGQIRDTFWDSRLFDGTPGFPGAILWFHNPAGMPSDVTQAAFEARIEASFQRVGSCRRWHSRGATRTGCQLRRSNGGGRPVRARRFQCDRVAARGCQAAPWPRHPAGSSLHPPPRLSMAQETRSCLCLAVRPSRFQDLPVSPIRPAPRSIAGCGSIASMRGRPRIYPAQAASMSNRSRRTRRGTSSGFPTRRSGDFTAINSASATMLPFGAAGRLDIPDARRGRQGVGPPHVREKPAWRTHCPNRWRAWNDTPSLSSEERRCEPATGVSVVAYPTAGRDRRTQPGRDLQRIASARGPSGRTVQWLGDLKRRAPARRPVLYHLRQNVRAGPRCFLLAAL